MNILSVENLTYYWGEYCLFNDLTFNITEGQKVALIARNGTGKSTLLSILIGKMFADSGKIEFLPDIKVGFLEQEPKFEINCSILDHVLSVDNDITRTIKQYELALERSDEKSLELTISKMDSLHAWDYENRLKQILSQLNIHDLSKNINDLSGGERKRVALAQLLVSEPNFIILDEPTNHLDLFVTQWLEEYLAKSRITLFMVTHDRYFLDRVCTNIYELEDGKIFQYHGNYQYYLEKKAEQISIQNAETEKARNLLRREKEWMNRQPQARGTKAQYRIDNFYELQKKAQVQTKKNDINLDFQQSRLGNKVVDLYGVSKSYDGKILLKNFSYKFAKGERVAIVGTNGAGKSTLLNIITGSITPDEGSVDIGETVVVGYYHQNGINIDDNKTVLETITDIADHISYGDKQVNAAQFLRNFLFPTQTHHVPISKLSGGERKRLYLLTILVHNPNLLILDEPTNDLDIMTLTVLEEFLLNFKGTLIIVSHDRFFVDRLAQHLFIVKDGTIKDFPGDYSTYLSETQRLKNNSDLQKTEKKDYVGKQYKTLKKLSYKERNELEEIEGSLEKLTNRRKEIEEKLSGGSTDKDEIERLSREYEQTNSEIDELELRWLELKEKEESLENNE